MADDPCSPSSTLEPDGAPSNLRAVNLAQSLDTPCLPRLLRQRKSPFPGLLEEPTPGLEPGTPSLRVNAPAFSDLSICMEDDSLAACSRSPELRGTPRSSSDVFQRCSKRT